MRKIEYLSPSSISIYLNDVEEFYLQYLCHDRSEREPQTRPMSVGSAFDAYVKSYLHEKLFGKGADPKFDFDSLFEAQVQEHNRDWAKDAGKYCFACYQKCGAINDLMLELHHTNVIGKPQFELEIKGVINGYRDGITSSIGGVTFLGKPDLFFINKHGANIILDWKVSGYCSRSNTSPKPGYVKLRGDSKKSEHKDAMLLMHHGVIINSGLYLEQIDEDWARQLSIYAWLSGCVTGDDYITAIDQLVCSPSGTIYPNIRVAEHRLRVSTHFQFDTFAKAQQIWDSIHSDHFFKDLTKEESIARCNLLENRAKDLPRTKEDQILREMAK